MTKFHHPSFSVGLTGKKYSDNWDRIFGKKDSACSEEDCEREVQDGNEMCNFHILMKSKEQGVEESPEEENE